MCGLDKYHYVYRISNKVLNKHYYGVRSSSVLPNEDLGIHYFSSSRDNEFKEGQKDNKEDYRYKIVRVLSTRKEAEEFESFLHLKFDVQNNENFYNKTNNTLSGFSFAGLSHSDETKKKIGEFSKGKVAVINTDNGNMEYVTVQQFRTNKNLISPHLNAPKSDGTKKKLSDARKGKVTVFDTITGTFICVTVQEFKNNSLLTAINDGMTLAKSLDTGECIHISTEEFKKRDDLVGNNKGMVTVINLETSEKYNVSKEEFFSNEILVSVNSGKTRSKEQKDRMSIAQKNRKRDCCIHCGVEMDIANLERWHNDRCKTLSKC